jgi:hypothetical protein
MFLVECGLHLFINPPSVMITFQMKQLGRIIKYSLDTFACEVSFLRLYTLFPRVILSHYPEEWSHNNERTVRVW